MGTRRRRGSSLSGETAKRNSYGEHLKRVEWGMLAGGMLGHENLVHPSNGAAVSRFTAAGFSILLGCTRYREELLDGGMKSGKVRIFRMLLESLRSAQFLLDMTGELVGKEKGSTRMMVLEDERDRIYTLAVREATGLRNMAAQTFLGDTKKLRLFLDSYQAKREFGNVTRRGFNVGGHPCVGPNIARSSS